MNRRTKEINNIRKGIRDLEIFLKMVEGSSRWAQYSDPVRAAERIEIAARYILADIQTEAS